MDPYKVLIEVVKTANFTKAAENLYTSQPSISRDIKRLEARYNVKIFEFTRPTICLTSDGEKILRYALQRENIEQELWHDLKNDLNIIAGSISIGSSYTYGEQYLSEKLIKVANEYPDLHVNAYLMNSDTVIDNVKHNIVDIGIIEREIQDNTLDLACISQDEMVLIYNRQIGFDKNQVCYVREQGSGTRVYQEIGLTRLELHPYLVEINSNQVIVDMVKAGKGFTVISKSVLEKEPKEVLASIELDVFRNFYLTKHKDKYVDNNLKAIIDLFECQYYNHETKKE